MLKLFVLSCLACALATAQLVTNPPTGAQGPAGPVGSAASATITGNGTTATLTITHNFGTATHSGPSCWDETSAAPYPQISGIENTFGTNSDTVTFPIAPYAGQVITCY